MADWKNSVNLPRTDFPMKANLQVAEPAAIARWEAMDLYGQIAKARAAGLHVEEVLEDLQGIARTLVARC